MTTKVTLLIALILFAAFPLRAATPDSLRAADASETEVRASEEVVIRWPSLRTTSPAAETKAATTSACARTECTIYMYCWYGTKECKADYLSNYCADGIAIMGACFCSNC